jgi:hypothetical protein
MLLDYVLWGLSVCFVLGVYCLAALEFIETLPHRLLSTALWILHFIDSLLHWKFAQIGIPVLSGIIGVMMVTYEKFGDAELCFFVAGLWGLLSLWRSPLSTLTKPYDKAVTRLVGGTVIGLIVAWLILETAERASKIAGIHTPTAKEIAQELARITPQELPTPKAVPKATPAVAGPVPTPAKPSDGRTLSE